MMEKSWRSSALCIVVMSLFTVPLRADELTFAKEFLPEGILPFIELSKGGFLGSAVDVSDPVVIQFDESGNVISSWEYPIRGNFRAYFDHLIETRDGGFAAIGARLFGGIRTTYDPIICKFDAARMPQWQIAFTGNSPISLDRSCRPQRAVI